MGIELPGWLRWVGGLVGEEFPEGDETACRRQSERWQHVADELERHKDGLEAARRTTLDGFATGHLHDAMQTEFDTLTSGDQSIDKIIEQLRQLAHAVDEAATEIEFAKEMFIVNLGILAVSLAAMIASAWINWGAPAEMAAAIAATEAILSQIIRAAIGKLVSEAALRVIERLAIKALEGGVMNAAISSGMNAAVQGQQIVQGNRHGFDLESLGNDALSGGLQGAVAAPFLRGVGERTPGFHPSERLSEFTRSFTGNTLGGLAAQAPTGQFDLGKAAAGGALFGGMDAARPTPRSLREDWSNGGAPAGLESAVPHPPEGKADVAPPGPAQAEPAPGVHNGSPDVDVPLNLGGHGHDADAVAPADPGAHPGGAENGSAPISSNSSTAPTETRHSAPQSQSEGPPSSSPSSSISPMSSEPSTTHGAEPPGAPVARSTDSVAPQSPSHTDAVDVRSSNGAEDIAPSRNDNEPADVAPAAKGPEQVETPSPKTGDPAAASTPRTPDRADTAAPAKSVERSETPQQPRTADRTETPPTRPQGARPSDAAAAQAGHAAGASGRESARVNADSAPPKAEGRQHPGPEQPHAADAVAQHGDSVPPAPEPRSTEPARTGAMDGAGNRAGDGAGEPRELKGYQLKMVELALSAEKLERDLLSNGSPPDIAASARHSPYASMSRQELLDKYFNPDGSVRWPPHDGFAGGKYEVADRIPKGLRLDRIGEVSADRGDFMGSAGDSYPSRALAPGSSGSYHHLEGTGRPLPPKWELRYGDVAAHFDQPGGGRQWVVVDHDVAPGGAPRKVFISELLVERYLIEVADAPHRADVGVTSDIDHAYPPSSPERQHHSAVPGRLDPPGGEHRVEQVHQMMDDFRNEQTHRDDPSTRSDDTGSLFSGEELTPGERQALRDAWGDLTPDERRYLYRREPMFGEHAGLPVEVCDHYSRQAVDDLRHDLMDRVERRGDSSAPHRSNSEDLNRLHILEDLREAVRNRPDEPAGRYLLGFEVDGRSITAIGNPDTAGATVVLVPGTFTSHEKLNPAPEARGLKNWFGLRPRFDKPGYMEVCQRIYHQLDEKFDDANVAVIDYQNYHAPQSLVPGAAKRIYAEEGAPELRNHLDRLQQTNRAEDSRFWVVGHSYGTTVVGEAAQGGRGLNADGIVNLGSPGMRVGDASGLILKGEHLVPGNAPVHTMTRVDDPIHVVDGARRMHLDRLGVGHGLMPHHRAFGGQVWEVDNQAGAHRDPHNAYFDADSLALRRIAEIVAGDTPPPFLPRQWGPRHSLPFTTGYFRPPPAEQDPDDERDGSSLGPDAEDRPR